MSISSRVRRLALLSPLASRCRVKSVTNSCSDRRERYFDPHNPKWSRYEMDEVNYHKAMESFAKAYPHAFKMLEKIRRDTPATIQSYKKSYVKSLGNDRIKRKKRSKRA
ncbi:MAG: hypothetical protein M3275_13255 [Thermoproteota archaeon]|nr:hypothetical protein [Thermoproteota archaeon]